jgi:hypothetical protein
LCGFDNVIHECLGKRRQGSTLELDDARRGFECERPGATYQLLADSGGMNSPLRWIEELGSEQFFQPLNALGERRLPDQSADAREA